MTAHYILKSAYKMCSNFISQYGLNLHLKVDFPSGKKVKQQSVA